jgi:uncharacterized protein
MRRVTVFFLTDALRQTLSNLRTDGTLWRWATWRSAARHLLGREGLLRSSYGPLEALLPARLSPESAPQRAVASMAGEQRAGLHPGR